MKYPPPTVQIANIPTSTKRKVVTVQYSIQGKGGGIGEVRVFHNGKLIRSDGFYRSVHLPGHEFQKVASLNGRAIYDQFRSMAGRGEVSPINAKEKDDNFQGTIRIEVAPGENTVSVAAFNGQNTVQSRLETISFEADIPFPDPHLFVLSVGIDLYEDQRIAQLKFAAKDAQNMAARIRKQAESLFQPQNIHVRVLQDKEADKENIMKAMEEISGRAGVGDCFIFFSAGHGLLLEAQYYLVPYDCDLGAKKPTMISSNDLVEMSKQIRALDQLLIFDTCHAGGVDYIVSGLYDARMSVLAKKVGLHVYAAASPEGEALDGYQGQNGLFTHVLLEGLGNNKAVDLNGDQKVSVTELGRFSKKRTSALAENLGHRQEPLIINFGQDYPVYELIRR